MPGLVGIISLKPDKRINIDTHKKICDSIFHRSWYKKIEIVHENRIWCFARIHHGIMNDMASPFHNISRNISIIIDGEVYDGRTERINDYEYVLCKYLKFGLDYTKELNGSFNIIIIDNQRKRIIISNDRTGSRPLYTYKDDQFLYLAPEIKAFLNIPSFSKKVNKKAIASFLYAGYLIGRESYFDDVKKLDNATTMSFDGEKIYKNKYWEYKFKEDLKDEGIEYYSNTAGELIRRAVKKRMGHENNTGIMLSGGFDSRAILGAYLENEERKKPATVTWGISEEIPNSDAEIARKLSKKIGTHHHFYRMDPKLMVENFKDIIFYNEGTTDTVGNYPHGLKIFEHIKENLNIDILLRGDQCFGCGGNLVFGIDDVLPAQGIFPLNSSPQYREIIDDSKYSNLSKNYDRLYKDTLERSKAKYYHNAKDFFHFDQRLYAYLNPLTYLKQIEIEIVNPLIDNDILDFINLVPYYHRVSKKFFHKAVRETFPEIDLLPIAHISSDISWEKVLYTDKTLQEFIKRNLIESENSFDSYLNKRELKDFLEDLFSGKIIKEGRSISLFTGPIKKILKRYGPIVKFARSLRAPWKTSIDSIIFRLITLKIWFGMFIDGNSTDL